MSDTMTNERIVAQQRRMVALVVFVTLAVVALGVAVVAGSAIGQLRDLSISAPADQVPASSLEVPASSLEVPASSLEVPVASVDAS